MVEPWLKVKGIAEHMCVSKETIYRMLKRKEIPCVKVGKLWLFKASLVDKKLLSNKNKPNKKTRRH